MINFQRNPATQPQYGSFSKSISANDIVTGKRQASVVVQGSSRTARVIFTTHEPVPVLSVRIFAQGSWILGCGLCGVRLLVPIAPTLRLPQPDAFQYQSARTGCWHSSGQNALYRVRLDRLPPSVRAMSVIPYSVFEYHRHYIAWRLSRISPKFEPRYKTSSLFRKSVHLPSSVFPSFHTRAPPGTTYNAHDVTAFLIVITDASHNSPALALFRYFYRPLIISFPSLPHLPANCS